ncbi:MAG: SRPBCC family protein [Actinomycetia bacterium]|nr:SRPBCC family protein [Actinomycetes bacterium]
MSKSEVVVTDTVAASIADVWRVASDFGGIDKIMDGIESLETEGEGVGMLRKIPMGGGEVVERLEELDEANYRTAYSIITAPLPFKDYYAVIQLSEVEGGTEVAWSGSFEPDGVPAEKAEKMARGIYAGGINGFKKALGAD